jgi:NADPH2:quinone reductase
MKAWLLDDFKGLDGLRLAEAPDPVPDKGEVVLEVEYAALNPADRYLAERLYPARPRMPHILGRDAIGTVVRQGGEVASPGVGERRLLLRGETGVNRPGTFARYVAVAAESLVEVPAGWSDAEAAGAPLVYLTAWQALTMWGPLAAPCVVLVTGASGGVGVASVQLAAALGHTVVALSRDRKKGERLRQLGAALALDPGDPGWRKVLKAELGSRRVALAVDSVGGKLLPEVIETLGDLGKISLVGRLAGPVPEFNTATLFFRRLRLGGVAVGSYTPAEGRAAWAEVVAILYRAGTRPQVDGIFPFEQLPQAFARLAQGPMGKVLLRVRDDAPLEIAAQKE